MRSGPLLFSSSFASQITSMIEFGRAHGRSDSWMMDAAHAFDRFCTNNYPGEGTLTQGLALAFAQAQGAESTTYHRQRILFARRLADFINSVGGDAYVIPKRFAPELVRYVPHILTDDELRRLFRAADDYVPADRLAHPFCALLLPVLLRLIYACGLRPQEGRTLKAADTDMRTGEIVLRKTKGNSERVVVMADDVAEMVHTYDIRRRAWFPDSEYLFPWRGGDVMGSDALDIQFKNCWRAANPGTRPEDLPRVRPYDLRHRFASAILTKWLDEGVDINSMLPFLQSYMGHKNIESTAYYVHILPENITKARGMDWAALEGLVPGVGA